jgi:YegS/Rv2252/BmrU family lipid kinase
VHLIVNPAAAGGRVGRQWPRLRERLQAVGFDLPFSMTKAPGHASDLAAEAIAQGHDVIVAAGGDGTICEALQGLHAANKGTLAILPLGTGNDAARTLGLPLKLEDAARLILTGATRRVDLMRAGDRVVLNAIGIGLLGTINVNAASIKIVRGIAAYLGAAAGTLFRYRCPHVELTNGGATSYSGPMTILAIHNGVTTGGGFRLCPRAVPDDGELDATLVAGTTVPQRLPALVDAMRGTLARQPFTQELRFTRLELRCDERLAYHWDGNGSYIEPPGMTFEVLPDALTVVAPGH